MFLSLLINNYNEIVRDSEVGHLTVRMMVVLTKQPIVNNSGNNNTQSSLPPCIVHEIKSTPMTSTTIRYDASRTCPFVYNTVEITWQRETSHKLGLSLLLTMV